LVARTAVPLKGRAGPPAEAPGPAAGGPPPPAPVSGASAASAPAKPVPPPPRHLDRPTLDKLAKGRLPIEARVDLHGMTQDEAYSLLFSFLHRAHAAGLRYVLVITGKGSSSGGD